jgi:hypothetical protein
MPLILLARFASAIVITLTLLANFAGAIAISDVCSN